MDPSRLYGSLQVMLFVLATGFALSATFLSDGVVASNGPAGRSLLQAKTPCTVNFEFMNYTILTSQCKGPSYLAGPCCLSFKQFACPYAAEINDLTTDCATTMFSYINLYGRYPPGLFASICREGKDGLNCTGVSSDSTAAQSSGGHHVGQRFSLAAAIIGPVAFVALLF